MTSCSEKSTPSPHSGLLLPGDYEFVFDLDTLQVPLQLNINEKGNWSFINWTEHIEIDTITWQDSTFQMKLPLFNTTLSGRVVDNQTITGKWIDQTRVDLYEIRFTAKKSNFPPLPKEEQFEKLVYSVLFSPDNPPAHDDAVGLFYRADSLLYGTFLTGSGDHRFLQGRYHVDRNRMTLSGFDGAHLFYYSANIIGDTLLGEFYSGKHYSTNWRGVLNPQAHLQHPDSISKLTNTDNDFIFKVKNSEGDSVQFGPQNLSNSVSIVQISGSWCANCTDETKFFKSLYEKYHSKGLQIIPVAFERTDNFEDAKRQVLSQYKELGLTYLPYFGGKVGGGAAKKVFSGIDNITAYPTSIFIDKKGKVRKIHTGFYGPGTGSLYKIHTAELESFVQMLLNE